MTIVSKKRLIQFGRDMEELYGRGFVKFKVRPAGKNRFDITKAKFQKSGIVYGEMALALKVADKALKGGFRDNVERARFLEEMPGTELVRAGVARGIRPHKVLDYVDKFLHIPIHRKTHFPAGKTRH